MTETIHIGPGEFYFDLLSPLNLYCILGSCVGLVVLQNNRVIGISHGRLPRDIKELTQKLLDKSQGLRDLKFLLFGGMSGEFNIGKVNIEAAQEVLYKNNIEYEDRSGKACVVKSFDGLMEIKDIKEK